jgi:predicted nucleic acid-binding protein
MAPTKLEKESFCLARTWEEFLLSTEKSFMAIYWLIDSNVLVYGFFHKPDEEGGQEPESKLRLYSRTLITLAAEGKLNSCVAQQNLLEFIAIVTSPKRVVSPVTLAEALRACQAYLSFCSLLTPKPSTYLTFETLAKKLRGARERIFDFYLAATALDNEVSHICTWNTKHLRPIPGLTVVTPSQAINLLAAS